MCMQVYTHTRGGGWSWEGEQTISLPVFKFSLLSSYYWLILYFTFLMFGVSSFNYNSCSPRADILLA